MLEVTYDGLPISWSSFNISVVAAMCVSQSIALAADTQPAVAGQAYQLVFSISDSYGNACSVQGMQFVVTAQGYHPLLSSLSGQKPLSVAILPCRLKRKIGVYTAPAFPSGVFTFR